MEKILLQWNKTVRETANMVKGFSTAVSYFTIISGLFFPELLLRIKCIQTTGTKDERPGKE